MIGKPHPIHPGAKGRVINTPPKARTIPTKTPKGTLPAVTRGSPKGGAPRGK